MIIAENSKPTLSEFRELMKDIDKVLNISASANSTYFYTRLGTALEEDVCAAALECAKNTKFEGFGISPMTAVLSGVVKKMDKDYKNNSKIKWNFTKFLIDRNGEIAARFEPTDMKKLEGKIKELL